MTDIQRFLGELSPAVVRDPLVIQARRLIDELGLDDKVEALRRRIEKAEKKPYLHAVENSKMKKWSYAEALGHVRDRRPELGSLYLHIPFCTKRCTYCHYYKETDVSTEVMDVLAEHLMAELRMVQQLMGVGMFRPYSIHFGGGTPSLLTIAQWTVLLDQVDRHVSRQVCEEIAIECSPEDVTVDKLQFWRDRGVNRLSLGVQSFSEPILRHLERIHDRETAIRAIEAAQRVGFTNINVDLMHAMPASTIPAWLADVRTARELGVPSVTIYATRPNPKDTDVQGKSGFPGLGSRVLGHAIAHEHFMGGGYFQFSPNQYIRSYEGRCLAKDRRNRCTSILGLGPAAHSIFQGVFYHNLGNLTSYLEKIASGQLCEVRGATLSEWEERVRYLQFGLKLSGLGKPVEENGAIRSGYRELFPGTDFEDDFRSKLDFLRSTGLGEVDESAARLSLAGMMLVGEVVQYFAEPEDGEVGSHREVPALEQLQT